MVLQYISTAEKKTWPILSKCQNDIEIHEICIWRDTKCKMRPFASKTVSADKLNRCESVSNVLYTSL